MLIEFSVSNFRSFQAEQTMSLVASADKSLLDTHTFATSAFPDQHLLASIVFYGANAAGKSNIVKAMEFARSLIVSTRSQGGDEPIKVPHFCFSDDGAECETVFEFHFIHEGVRYQYGFGIKGGWIQHEWLNAYPKGRQQKWFERLATDNVEEPEWYFGSHLKKDKKGITAVTRPGLLFLHVAARLARHPQLSVVFGWFARTLRILPPGMSESALELISVNMLDHEPHGLQAIRTLLQKADLGIADVSVERRPYDEDDLPTDMPEPLRQLFTESEHIKVQLAHRMRNDSTRIIPLEIDDESRGTRRLFGLGGPLAEALQRGVVLVVDELDSSLHPLLVREILGLFHNPETNPHHAQLIFNTHDVTLLDPELFRRDQIWFVEKDRDGASHVYSLLEFSPRKGEAIQKGYLTGRYGAVPFISGALIEVFSNAPAQE